MNGDFVVEYLSDWADYPSWEEGERVASVDEGEALITGILDADFARASARYQELKPRADKARDLFNRRRAALEAAGLWKQPDESFIPLLGPISAGPEPVRADGSNWRVRSAAEVDDDA